MPVPRETCIVLVVPPCSRANADHGLRCDCRRRATLSAHPLPPIAQHVRYGDRLSIVTSVALPTRPLQAAGPPTRLPLRRCPAARSMVVRRHDRNRPTLHAASQTRPPPRRTSWCGNTIAAAPARSMVVRPHDRCPPAAHALVLDTRRCPTAIDRGSGPRHGVAARRRASAPGPAVVPPSEWRRPSLWSCQRSCLAADACAPPARGLPSRQPPGADRSHAGKRRPTAISASWHILTNSGQALVSVTDTRASAGPRHAKAASPYLRST